MASSIKHLVRSFIVGFSISQAALCNAATFTIDSSQSYLEAIVGFGLSAPQFPGSDRAALSGAFEVQLDAGTIGFPNGMSIAFLNQASPVEPLSGGLPGGSAGNYGLIYEVGLLVGQYGIGDVAMRDMHLTLAAGAGNIVSNNFSSQLDGTFTAGNIDINLDLINIGPNPNVYGTAGLGSAGSFLVVDGGQIQVTGTQATLTIPVEFWMDVSGFQLNAGSIPGALPLHFQGQIVATGLVAEPSSLVLAFIGTAACLGVALRRRK